MLPAGIVEGGEVICVDGVWADTDGEPVTGPAEGDRLIVRTIVVAGDLALLTFEPGGDCFEARAFVAAGDKQAADQAMFEKIARDAVVAPELVP